MTHIHHPRTCVCVCVCDYLEPWHRWTELMNATLTIVLHRISLCVSV